MKKLKKKLEQLLAEENVRLEQVAHPRSDVYIVYHRMSIYLSPGEIDFMMQAYATYHKAIGAYEEYDFISMIKEECLKS